MAHIDPITGETRTDLTEVQLAFEEKLHVIANAINSLIGDQRESDEVRDFVGSDPKFGAQALAGLGTGEPLFTATVEHARTLVGEITLDVEAASGFTPLNSLVAELLVDPSVTRAAVGTDDFNAAFPLFAAEADTDMGRALLTEVLKRNREIALFPTAPTRPRQETEALQSMIDQKMLTWDDVHPVNGLRDQRTTAIIERLGDQMPDIMKQAVAETGTGTLVEGTKSLTRQFDRIPDVFQDVLFDKQERARQESIAKTMDPATGELKSTKDILQKAFDDANIRTTSAQYSDPAEFNAFKAFREEVRILVQDRREELERLRTPVEDIAFELAVTVQQGLLRQGQSAQQFQEGADAAAAQKAADELTEADKNLVAAGKAALAEAGLIPSDLTPADLQAVYDSIRDFGSEETTTEIKALKEEGIFRRNKQALEEREKAKALRVEERTPTGAATGLKQVLFELGARPVELTDERRLELEGRVSDFGADTLSGELSPSLLESFRNEKKAQDILAGGAQALRDAVVGLGVGAQVGGVSQADVVLRDGVGERILQTIAANPGVDPRTIIAAQLGLGDGAEPVAAPGGPPTEAEGPGFLSAGGERTVPGEEEPVETSLTVRPFEPELPSLFAAKEDFQRQFDPGLIPAIPTVGGVSATVKGTRELAKNMFDQPWGALTAIQKQEVSDAFIKAGGARDALVPTHATARLGIGAPQKPEIQFPKGNELEELIFERSGGDRFLRELLTKQAQQALPLFTEQAQGAIADRRRAAHERALGFEQQVGREGAFTSEQVLSLFQQEFNQPLPEEKGSFLPFFEKRLEGFGPDFGKLPGFERTVEDRRRRTLRRRGRSATRLG